MFAAKQAVLFHLLNVNLLMDLGMTPQDTDVTHQYSPPVTGDEECLTMYGQLVCFSLLAPWVGPSRPVVKAPRKPSGLGTTFSLYTRLNDSYPHILDPDDLGTILSAPYVAGKPFRVVSHGYLSSGASSWVLMMKGELLRAGDENVVVVDWSVGAVPPYTQAVANIRLVGAQLAYLLYCLNRFADVPTANFHLIGHSLGSHLSGYAGTYLRDWYGLQVPRITGLDPAEPYFNDTHPITRLDPSDAAFVDVIHTDDTPILGFPLSLGMTAPVGHLDFYPNGGLQPGCEDEPNCQHKRAITYFTESIRQSCPLLAVVCPSYQQFLDGECWGCGDEQLCCPMGLDAAPLPVSAHTKLFLTTRDRSPFCGYHYRVSVEVSNTSAARDHLGEFAITHVQLAGHKDSTRPLSLSDQSHYYEAGTVHRRVVLTQDVGRLHTVNVYFEDPTWLLPRFNRGLYAKAITVEPLAGRVKWRFCFQEEFQKLDKEYILTTKDAC